jgi:hypothetical protein
MLQCFMNAITAPSGSQILKGSKCLFPLCRPVDFLCWTFSLLPKNLEKYLESFPFSAKVCQIKKLKKKKKTKQNKSKSKSKMKANYSQILAFSETLCSGQSQQRELYSACMFNDLHQQSGAVRISYRNIPTSIPDSGWKLMSYIIHRI